MDHNNENEVEENINEIAHLVKSIQAMENLQREVSKMQCVVDTLVVYQDNFHERKD